MVREYLKLFFSFNSCYLQDYNALYPLDGANRCGYTLWVGNVGECPVPPILLSDMSGDCCKLVFASVLSYSMDTYRHLCASALAAIVVLRCILAAVFPLFPHKMFESLGDQWGLTIFAILSLVCAPFPFLFYVSYSCLYIILVFNYRAQVFGARIRAASHFASEFEKKDIKELEKQDAKESEKKEATVC